MTGTGNPWAGQVIDTEAELAVGLTTFMSAFVNFGFALDTGSDTGKTHPGGQVHVILLLIDQLLHQTFPRT